LRKPLCTLRLMDLGFMLNYPRNYDKFAANQLILITDGSSMWNNRDN
jgi:hypothetical protein